MRCEEGDIPFAMAQRRKLDACNCETVVEILAELSRLDLALEVTTSGDEKTDIDLAPSGTAHSLNLGAFDSAKKFRLESDIEIADHRR